MADLISNDVDDIIKRMQKAKGVTGLIVINSDGIPIRTNLDNSTTVSYAGLIQQLVGKSTSVVRDLDPTNDLKFLRIKSKKHEIMASPVEVQQIEFALRTPNKMVDEYWSHGVDLMDILHGSAEIPPSWSITGQFNQLLKIPQGSGVDPGLTMITESADKATENGYLLIVVQEIQDGESQ